MTDRGRDTAALLRHLVRMHEAGLPWLQSLQMWQETCRGRRARRQAQALIRAMRQGQSLTEALGSVGGLSRPLQALSRAGEASGTWSAQMGQWLSRHEQQARQWRQVRAALTYPLLVVVLGIGILSGVMAWVMPVFESLYGQLQADLPGATRALLWAREFWTERGTVALLLCSLGAWAVVWAWRHPQGRAGLEQVLWRAPGLGRWWQMHLEALWSGLLAQLLHAGLDWSSALALIGPASGSPLMSRALGELARDLAQGHGLAAAMAAGNRRWHRRCGRTMYSPTLVHWTQAGEASGTLPQMLSQWSAMQAESLSEEGQQATRWLEPILMALLGLGMGWLVLALYLPVMQMGQWL
ncbi:MAG: type II secretion system F family protein [Alphaproteobacteria bacterium]|nr:type II secretion system F family protein [Alphaproteobacteria bacterium]